MLRTFAKWFIAWWIAGFMGTLYVGLCWALVGQPVEPAALLGCALGMALLLGVCLGWAGVMP